MRKQLLLAIAFLSVLAAPAQGTFTTPEEIKWFDDARYSMYIYFGLSTYIAAPDEMELDRGLIADEVWSKQPEKFSFEHFEAKRWVEIAQKMGVTQIMMRAKYHDGFHLWNTQYSYFKVTNTPFGRDYLKEINEACQEANIKFGIYYLQADWYHPNYVPENTHRIDPLRNPPFIYRKRRKAEIYTEKGLMKVLFYEKDAPGTVDNFCQLANEKFYDGLTFHRVIPDFVIQGGCPDGSGEGGPGYTIKCELDGENQYHDRGVISMAHAGRDTGGSQFFICHNRKHTAHLDRRHTCFGKVYEGLEVIDKIQIGDKMLKIVIIDE
ncbi:MAG: peptidylprolyl isomerase [Mangrovibacterium sp.]